VITHWDEVEGTRRERGHITASWQSLSGANSVTAGLRRITVEPGRWSTPLHLEGSEEEIFYVLSGTGVSYQGEDDAEWATAIGPGDCLVHRALEHAHTLGAGDERLVALVFGQRHYAANTLLPRAGVSWLGTTWVLQGAPEDHPWDREAAVGAPAWDELVARPSTIVNISDVSGRDREHGSVSTVVRDLGTAVGSERTGLSHYVIAPGKLMNPPHVHSSEEEIFVVLDGAGTLQLYPSARDGGSVEEFPVRAGDTISRPGGTRRAHGLRAGDDGMTVLAFSTRDPNDIIYYPRSGKISFAGVGVIGRLEQLDYWDGED